MKKYKILHIPTASYVSISARHMPVLENFPSEKKARRTLESFRYKYFILMNGILQYDYTEAIRDGSPLYRPCERMYEYAILEYDDENN